MANDNEKIPTNRWWHDWLLELRKLKQNGVTLSEIRTAIDASATGRSGIEAAHDLANRRRNAQHGQ